MFIIMSKFLLFLKKNCLYLSENAIFLENAKSKSRFEQRKFDLALKM